MCLACCGLQLPGCSLRRRTLQDEAQRAAWELTTPGSSSDYADGAARLARIEQSGRPGVEALLAGLQSHDLRVRETCAGALGDMRCSAAVGDLTGVVSRDPKGTGEGGVAIGALVKIASPASFVTFTQVLAANPSNVGSESMAHEAFLGLIALGDARAVPLAGRYLDDRQRSRDAIRCLGVVGGRAAVRLLTEDARKLRLERLPAAPKDRRELIAERGLVKAALAEAERRR